MIGAVERTRTSTVLLPPAPQAGASASSATTAQERRHSKLRAVMSQGREEGSRADMGRSALCPMYVDFGMRLAWRTGRVALAGNPRAPEAARRLASLVVDRPPRPSFQRLRRITGHKSLHLQGQSGTCSGSGSRSHSLLPGGSDGQDGSVWHGSECAGVGGGP
jgi:hypothetical protein